MKVFYARKLKELTTLVISGTTSKTIEQDIENYTIMLDSTKHKEEARLMELQAKANSVINEKAPEGCESGACSI